MTPGSHPPGIHRASEYGTIALTNDAATTARVDLSRAAGGRIYVPIGSGITSLTFYDAPHVGGTMVASQDELGSAIVLTVAAAKSYPLPDCLFGASEIAMVANASGNVDVALKT
jgi:hypothetical protein